MALGIVVNWPLWAESVSDSVFFVMDSRIRAFTCNNQKVNSLDISNCVDLKTLQCSGNKLTSLELDGCTVLQYLYCSSNQLPSLDVSDCAYLRKLWCDNNALTSLDVSNHWYLTKLGCWNNQLTTLDVSHTAMDSLFCYDNQLTSLDVSSCTDLIKLSCGNNALTSLDISGCTYLRDFWCYGNALTSLKLDNCENLEGLMAWDNALTTVDISRNAKLKWLNVDNNAMMLSSVAKLLQNISAYNIENHAASPQTPVVRLKVGEDYSLLRELSFNSIETDVTVEDMNGNPLPEDLYSMGIGNISVRFNQGGIYRIRLKNTSLRSKEYDYSGFSTTIYQYNFSDVLYPVECVITAEVGDLAYDTAVFSWNAAAGGGKAFSFAGKEGKGSFMVDWGDGTTNTYASQDAIGVPVYHAYADNGNYEVRLISRSAQSEITSLDIAEAGVTAIDVQACGSLRKLDAHGNALWLSDVATLVTALNDAGVRHRLSEQRHSMDLKVDSAADLGRDIRVDAVESEIKVYDEQGLAADTAYNVTNDWIVFTQEGSYRVCLTNGGVLTYADWEATAKTPAVSEWRFSVEANPPVPYFNVQLISGNVAWGRVAQSGDGSYQEGAQVTITATPNEGYRFISWTRQDGSVFSTEAVHTFTVTENIELTANFEERPAGIETFTVVLSVNDSAWGRVSQTGDGTYEENSQLTITATPKEGCRFVNWTKKNGSVFSTEAVYTFTVKENLELTANFEERPVAVTFTVVLSANNSDWGHVSQTGNGTYEEGSQLTITATPKEGFRFVNWTKKDGAVFSTEAVHTFTVTENLELTANFNRMGVDNRDYEAAGLKIYPNPNRGTFYIDLPEASLVEIFSQTGALCYRKQLSAGISILKIPNGGLYFVRVNNIVARVVVY